MLKTLLKQKDEEDNSPLLLAVQVRGVLSVIVVIFVIVAFRQATVMQWSFSSTRLTRSATSTN